MNKLNMLEQINGIIKSKSLLTHPFYQAWSNGTLSMDSLKNYAQQYYHFELAYPTFISGIHHRCADRDVRQALLGNLWDEEQGVDNHVDLWLRFCEGLGLDKNAVKESSPISATVNLINTFKELTSTDPISAGVATLYAYESQVPDVASAKLIGLRDNYGIEEESVVSFFKVHQMMDQDHSDAERNIIVDLTHSDSEFSGVTEAVDKATDALWAFLDGVYTP